MATFIISFIISLGILLALGAPVLFTARRRGRAETVRRFLIAAGVIALLSGILAASSTKLTEQCEAAGNPGCVDSGSFGMQVLFFGGFAITAWLNAYFISRN